MQRYYIFEINDAFNAYNKIFKDGIGEYYYGELDQVIAHWQKILDSKAELDTYLDFTNQIRVLFKHKLFKLANKKFTYNIKKIKIKKIRRELIM